jgi:hypothetical protein
MQDHQITSCLIFLQNRFRKDCHTGSVKKNKMMTVKEHNETNAFYLQLSRYGYYFFENYNNK